MSGPVFPQVPPTGRTYGAGDFPVKTYRAQDGAEVRILYGNKRVGMTLGLQFNNITDEIAEAFLIHYHDCQGTFQQFELSDGSGSLAKAGWEGTTKGIGAQFWGSKWRYQNEPQVTSVYPGRSTVSISLIAATI